MQYVFKSHLIDCMPMQLPSPITGWRLCPIDSKKRWEILQRKVGEMRSGTTQKLRKNIKNEIWTHRAELYII